jgi:glucokinase
MRYVIGIDLGGTNVKGAVLAEDGTVALHHYIPTHADGDGQWRSNVLAMAHWLLERHPAPIEAIGLSAPGLASAANDCILFLPNRLNGLENFIWSDYLPKHSFVLNDAHAALMAEAKFGAAKTFKNVVLLTLGTGVGGGLLIDGHLYQGLNQMAGHFGHLSIDADNQELSILGMPGSLEFSMGNYSVPKRTHQRFASTAALVEAYQRGDHFATYSWLSSVRRLAIGIASLINGLSPDAVILSGGITLAGQSLYDPLHAFLDQYEWRPGGKKTPVIQAHFSDLSGVVGAASFAFSRL